MMFARPQIVAVHVQELQRLGARPDASQKQRDEDSVELTHRIVEYLIYTKEDTKMG
jgi:hypothetical protein